MEITNELKKAWQEFDAEIVAAAKINLDKWAELGRHVEERERANGWPADPWPKVEPVRIDYDLMEVVPADHSDMSGQYTNESHAMGFIGAVETVVPLPLVHSDFEFVAKRLDSWSMGGLAKIQSAGQHIADPGIKRDMRQMSIGPGSESWPKVEGVGYRDSLQLDLLNLKPGQQFEERIGEKGNRFYRIYDAVPSLPEEPVAAPVVVEG